MNIYTSEVEYLRDKVKKLEEALAKQEQGKPVAGYYFPLTNETMRGSIEALIAHAKRARWTDAIVRKDGVETKYEADWIKKLVPYTTPQPKQEQGEPVAKYIGECSEGSLVQLFEDVKKGTNFYTTPQQRKPLTDEQIKKAFEDWAKENYVQGFEPYGDSYHNGHTRNRWQGWLAAHRAIEASHGIKE